MKVLPCLLQRRSRPCFGQKKGGVLSKGTLNEKEKRRFRRSRQKRFCRIESDTERSASSTRLLFCSGSRRERFGFGQPFFRLTNKLRTRHGQVGTESDSLGKVSFFLKKKTRHSDKRPMAFSKDSMVEIGSFLFSGG